VVLQVVATYTLVRVHSLAKLHGVIIQNTVIGKLKAWMYMTFRGPCIMIYSYNKNQRDAQFLKFI
jgi:hypothetical protein